MRRLIRIALMALVALAVIVPAQAAGKVTVGDFISQIANVKNLPAQDGATATASLRAAGYNLPALDLAAPLNEGTVAKIAGSFGLKVTTSNAAAPFNSSQSAAFVSTFGQLITGPGLGVEPTHRHRGGGGWGGWWGGWYHGGNWWWHWWHHWDHHKSRNCP